MATFEVCYEDDGQRKVACIESDAARFNGSFIAFVNEPDAGEDHRKTVAVFPSHVIRWIRNANSELNL